MHFSYARYLENKIRESFGFEGTSIKFVFREKGEKKKMYNATGLLGNTESSMIGCIIMGDRCLIL